MRKEPKKPLPLIPDGRLAQVIEYITENLGSDLSVGDLASIARMGLSGFARSFKATVGVTPHAYLLQERIEKAKRLLAANHFSMADIALESGFGSQAHFTKCFTKWLEPHPALTVGVWGVVSRTGAEIEKTLGRNLKDWPALRNYTE